MLAEPHIEPKALAAITAPTLVMAGNRDLAEDEHTVTIYSRLCKGQDTVISFDVE